MLVDRSARQAIIVDVTVTHDDNLLMEENKKLNKYFDFIREVNGMWNVKSIRNPR